MAKILVTGSEGLIGRYVTFQLRRANREIVPFDIKLDAAQDVTYRPIRSSETTSAGSERTRAGKLRRRQTHGEQSPAPRPRQGQPARQTTSRRLGRRLPRKYD